MLRKTGSDVSQFDADLFRFPCEIEELKTVATVGDALVRAMKPMGFDSYVIGTFPPPDNPYPTPFTIHNLPASFWDSYYAGRMAERDPAIRAATLNCAPISFQQIRDGEARFTPSIEELEVLDTVAALGQPHGLIVPVYRSQGYRGIVALTGPGPDPDGRTRAILQFLAMHAHDRMRNLFSPAEPHSPNLLSPREIELLTFALRGLNDDEIANITGITTRTVRFHFENARRKLQARNRAEVIATAVNLHLLPL